jgi:hypothetical protein
MRYLDKKIKWWRRPTIGTLRAGDPQPEEPQSDLTGDTLRNDESVALAGMVIVEAATPARLAGVLNSVKNLDFQDKQKPNEIVDSLLAARDRYERPSIFTLMQLRRPPNLRDRPKQWEINLLPLLPAAVVPPVHGEAVYLGGLASGPPRSSGTRSVLG